MAATELFADLIHRNAGMLTDSLKDFSDADIMVRPVPAANHTAWQLGHLIAVDNMLFSSMGAKMPELPAGFAERFTKATCASDDAKSFGSKADLVGLMQQSTDAACAFARSLSDADLAKPTPEKLRNFIPTLGHLLSMRSSHIMMHLGQVQVVRRKLGKPILF